MRAFVKFRELASNNSWILKEIDSLEKRVSRHDKQLQRPFVDVV